MNVLQSTLNIFTVIAFICFSQFAHPSLNESKIRLDTEHLTNIKNINGHQPKWWKEAVVYQVYPRSFKDTNNDGIGDLRGLISKLDYFKNLGIDMIWLSPHYDSPNVDNGYDVRDYHKVMAEFGTMKDFDDLVRGIKQRHMKLIVDLVANHTSDEHHWFVESRKSKKNFYRDYYIWRPGKNGNPPNNYPSIFSESAWKLDSNTNEYYLHYFDAKQPDLNWDNPKVRTEIYNLMKFWLGKGVDGFRIDSISLISKPNLTDLTAAQLLQPQFEYSKGPHLHEYLQEMNREVLSKYNAVSIGETFGIPFEQTPLLIDERRNELDMIFNFDAVRINHEGHMWRDWTLPELKAIYARQDQVLGTHSWNTLFLSNHDNARLVSSFGDDSEVFREASAKVLATLLLTLKGTPFIYQGDELGMTNYPFKNINDFNDVWVLNTWNADVVSGNIKAQDLISNLRKTSRDNARTPMQWDDSRNGGFTNAAKTWLAINPNYKKINAKQNLSDPNSIYHYYRQLIALRKNTPALIYGTYRDLDPLNKKIYAYTRTLDKDKFLIILNFSRDNINYKLPSGLKLGELVISNLNQNYKNKSELHLKGWEASIYKIS